MFSFTQMVEVKLVLTCVMFFNCSPHPFARVLATSAKSNMIRHRLAYTSPPLDWPGAEHLAHNPRRLQAPQDTQQAERETAGCRRLLLHRCISTSLGLHTSYSAPITKLLEQHANTPVRVHSHKWVLFLAVILAFWHLLLQYNTKYVSFNSSLTVPVYLLKIVGLVYSTVAEEAEALLHLVLPFLKLCVLIHCAHNMKDFPEGSFEM